LRISKKGTVLGLDVTINNTNLEIILVLFGVILSLIFLYMSRPYWVSDTKWYVKLTLSFLVASFISSAIGMILERNSIIGGIFLLLVFLPFLYVFYVSGFLLVDGFILGMLEGGYLSFYSYFKNSFDRLAMYLRRLIMAFFVFTSLYLIIRAFTTMNESFQEVPQNEISEFIILIGILFTFSFLLKGTIHGIRAYDVFVYGPSGSGKTLLLLALYNQFVVFLGGERTEFIVSEKNKESLKIGNMLAALEKGELPKSNLRTDLALYKLSGKKGFKPVRMKFIDYGGEHTKDFDPNIYQKTIDELHDSFDKDTVELNTKIEDINYIKELQKSNPDNFTQSVEKVVFAHIYKSLVNAGKIIFLVDGDHIVNFHDGDGKRYLTELFGQYSDIIGTFGNEKSYAIVVTKTDKFEDLSKILENSKDADDLEYKIYEMFYKIDPFKEIVNKSEKIPIYMYTVSVDATMKPQTMESEDAGKQKKCLKINPWRVAEIEKFSF